MQSGREIHLSFRVVVPPKPAAGGLDVLLTYPRSKEIPMIRVGFGEAIDIPPEQYRYEKHVHPPKTVPDPEHGTTVYHIIDLPKSVFNDFYNGMANGFFWPLNHQRSDILKMPYMSLDAAGREIFNGERFRREARAVRFVNDVFSRFIAEKLAPTSDDTIVVHDYHFFGAGKCLRDRGVNCPIAFFLHTPAPPHELYKNLHKVQQDYVHNTLLELFRYNRIGVQATRDLRNIWSIIGDGSPPPNLSLYQPYEMERNDQDENKNWRKRITEISVMPVAGHDILDAAQAVEARAEAEEYLRTEIGFPQPNIFTWGRLDYSKNGVNQAKSVGMAIQHFGLAGDQVCFLHQAAYGRSDVQAYQQEYAKVRAAHADLTRRHRPNGLRSKLYTETVARRILLAIAREAEVGLITPEIDGYNITAREYIASQKGKKVPGVLVLANNAGVAGILNGKSALLVDATSPYEIARNISLAWRMPERQKIAMHEEAEKQFGEHTNEKWQSELIDGARKSYERRSPARFDRHAVRGAAPGGV